MSSFPAGIEKFKPVCNSIECPDNYTPIDDAANVLCDGGVCEVSQCCEAYCSYYACPNGYTPVEDADLILCPTTGSGCTKSLCCGKRKPFFEELYLLLAR